MAIIKPISNHVGGDNSLVTKVAWNGLRKGDVGGHIDFTLWAACSLQITGIYGTGYVQFEGSNDGGSTFNLLSDAGGEHLTFSHNRLSSVREVAAFARPKVVRGDDTTLINVILVMRRAQAIRV